MRWPTLELRPLSTLNEISCSSHSRESCRTVDPFLTQDINKQSSAYHLWTEALFRSNFFFGFWHCSAFFFIWRCAISIWCDDGESWKVFGF
jgi:hypothetical protein